MDIVWEMSSSFNRTASCPLPHKQPLWYMWRVELKVNIAAFQAMYPGIIIYSGMAGNTKAVLYSGSSARTYKEKPELSTELSLSMSDAKK